MGAHTIEICVLNSDKQYDLKIAAIAGRTVLDSMEVVTGGAHTIGIFLLNSDEKDDL